MFTGEGLTMREIEKARDMILAETGAMIDRRFEFKQPDGTYDSIIVVDAPEPATENIRALAYIEQLYGKPAPPLGCD